MTTNYNENISFRSASLLNIQANSITGQVARFGGWSFLGGFNPGVTSSGTNRAFDPNNATLPEIRNVLATFMMDFLKPR